VRVKKLIVRFGTERYFPVIGAKTYEYTDRAERAFAPRIAIYREGLTENDGTGTYNSAACDPYDYEGAVIGDYSLQWHQDLSIFQNIWSPIQAFFKRSRILQYAVNFSAEQLHSIARYRVVKMMRSVILFKSLRTRLTEKGTEDQEIEGWLI
jgi:hypothetical protein